ncbi:DEKNAAC100368 [Brettanomyces naardenensis]|uniref:Ubiquitin-like protein ATG12 n=1 Tax=Brettanomyces naardenensis TaxID=13370 RepID=A0A448YGX1_BRENA|nr:DEKNAAC100368 [Brettanomyces naardenensis]
MEEEDDDLRKLTGSLLQLNVSVAAPRSDNAKEDNSESDSQDDEGDEEQSSSRQPTIKNSAPIKSKITISHSKILSRLPSRATSSLLVVSKRDNAKVQIRFKSIGSIDQLRPTVFKISRDSKFLSISKFLQRRLKIKRVYCYLANSVVPNPDDEIGNLFDLFKSGDEELIVSYCNIVAFG